MNYKIGNKVDVIIRAFNAGTMGSMQIQYKNQPYTILRDVNATLTFVAKDANSRQGEKNLLSFNHDSISRIDINGVVLNDKILNLLYTKKTIMPAIVPIKVIKAPACRIPLPFFTVEIKVPFNTRKLPSGRKQEIRTRSIPTI